MALRKILVVDDDEDINLLLSMLLKSRNYEVDNAYNGEEALSKSKRRPDLILLDRTLPDTEGLEICRKLREDKRLRNIPIIMLTARDKPSDKIEGLYVGADDYITKPFDREELLARIGAALRRSDFSERAKEDNADLIVELKKILKEELITPFFQPIFAFPSLEPIGFEALSRPSSDSPLSNPEFLFKAALNFGMYFELEMLCWRKALKVWKQKGCPSKIFLNCSPYLIEHNRFNDMAISDAGVSPSGIVLELTERMAIVDYGLFLEKINEFKRMKVSLTIDDVGCGFASLDAVAEIKPEFVKIDMPLVRNIQNDGVRQSIVEAVVSFCKKCNIIAIAEGIEQKEELKTVIDLGVDGGQGYLLARPNAEIKTQCDISL